MKPWKIWKDIADEAIGNVADEIEEGLPLATANEYAGDTATAMWFEPLAVWLALTRKEREEVRALVYRGMDKEDAVGEVAHRKAVAIVRERARGQLGVELR